MLSSVLSFYPLNAKATPLPAADNQTCPRERAVTPTEIHHRKGGQKQNVDIQITKTNNKTPFSRQYRTIKHCLEFEPFQKDDLLGKSVNVQKAFMAKLRRVATTWDREDHVHNYGKGSKNRYRNKRLY